MAIEDEPEYTITVEYDDFITRFDLDEILGSIDRIIEAEVLGALDRPLRFRLGPYQWRYREPEDADFSYIGIKSVGAGSITFTIFASGIVLGYVAKRFRKGVDTSLFAEEIERSGRLSGDVIGSALARVNNWVERFVPKQRELGGKVTKITVKRKQG